MWFTVVEYGLDWNVNQMLIFSGSGQLEVSDTGTLHRVRAVCERGLQHRAARHCPLLWRMYLKFEVSGKN